MLILGVDPGLISTGVGVIEIPETRSSAEMRYGVPAEGLKFIHAETLKPPRLALPQRLLFIHRRLIEIIQHYEVLCLAVEDQFFGENVQTAFKTGQARGAALLAAAVCGIPVTLYPPARIKMAVVGNGRASKEQVQHLVQQILRLNAPPDSLDASDALAVALCHAFST